MTQRSLCLTLIAVALGCSKSDAARNDPPASPPGASAPAQVAATETSKPADWSKVDKAVAAAKGSDDFDRVFGECLSVGMEVAMAKKINDIETDPDYYTHCAVGPARAQARIAIKESKPNKMHSLCIAASIKAEEIAGSGKPEAAEFKKLAKEIKKACGL